MNDDPNGLNTPMPVSLSYREEHLTTPNVLARKLDLPRGDYNRPLDRERTKNHFLELG